MMQLVPLKEVRRSALAVSSLLERCEDGVSLCGRTGRVAGKQRGRVCRRLLDDPEVGRINHLHIGEGVDESSSVGLENDLVSNDKFVYVQEHLVLTHPMTRNDHIALCSGHRSAGPVARAQIEGRLPNSLVQSHFDADSGN